MVGSIDRSKPGVHRVVHDVAEGWQGHGPWPSLRDVPVTKMWPAKAWDCTKKATRKATRDSRCEALILFDGLGGGGRGRKSFGFWRLMCTPPAPACRSVQGGGREGEMWVSVEVGGVGGLRMDWLRCPCCPLSRATAKARSPWHTLPGHPLDILSALSRLPPQPHTHRLAPRFRVPHHVHGVPTRPLIPQQAKVARRAAARISI